MGGAAGGAAGGLMAFVQAAGERPFSALLLPEIGSIFLEGNLEISIKCTNMQAVPSVIPLFGISALEKYCHKY